MNLAIKQFTLKPVKKSIHFPRQSPFFKAYFFLLKNKFQYKNLRKLSFSRLLTVLFISLSLENIVPRRNSFREPNKWKSEGARSRLWGGCGSCSQPNWPIVSTVLAPEWSLALSIWNSMTIDVRKGKVFVHNFVCCTYRNSQMFRNVLYCNSSVS